MAYRFTKIKDASLNLNYNEWFFECTDIIGLIEHTERYMSNTIERGIKDYFERGEYHANTSWRCYTECLAKTRETTYIKASMELEQNVFSGKLKSLDKFGNILLRDSGSYMILTDHYTVIESIYKEEMVYPNYCETDINITQWKGGKHFYAKIGNLDVVIDDEQKWDTYKEAYNNAKLYLKELL